MKVINLITIKLARLHTQLHLPQNLRHRLNFNLGRERWCLFEVALLCSIMIQQLIQTTVVTQWLTLNLYKCQKNIPGETFMRLSARWTTAQFSHYRRHWKYWVINSIFKIHQSMRRQVWSKMLSIIWTMIWLKLNNVLKLT